MIEWYPPETPGERRVLAVLVWLARVRWAVGLGLLVAGLAGAAVGLPVQVIAALGVLLSPLAWLAHGARAADSARPGPRPHRGPGPR